MSLVSRLLRRPYALSDLERSCEGYLESPPLPQDFLLMMHGIRASDGVHLIDYWRSQFRSTLSDVATKRTWQHQRSTLIRAVLEERAWSTLYAVTKDAKHLESWYHQCGAGIREDREGAPYKIFKRHLVAILSSVCLYTTGEVLYGVDKQTGDFIDLHAMFDKENRRLDVTMRETIREISDLGGDIEPAVAFQECQVLPVLKANIAALSWLGDQVSSSAMDIAQVVHVIRPLNEKLGTINDQLRLREFPQLDWAAKWIENNPEALD